MLLNQTEISTLTVPQQASCKAPYTQPSLLGLVGTSGACQCWPDIAEEQVICSRSSSSLLSMVSQQSSREVGAIHIGQCTYLDPRTIDLCRFSLQNNERLKALDIMGTMQAYDAYTQDLSADRPPRLSWRLDDWELISASSHACTMVVLPCDLNSVQFLGL